jgi:hypothetical protein
MNRLPRVFLVLAVSAVIGGSAAGGAGQADATPIATTSTAFLTIAEAHQATRREVFRIARKRDEGVEIFVIKWCRRRSGVRVGCRYDLALDDGGWRGLDCIGGARVVERGPNRHHVRVWRDCTVPAD